MLHSMILCNVKTITNFIIYFTFQQRKEGDNKIYQQKKKIYNAYEAINFVYNKKKLFDQTIFC